MMILSTQRSLLEHIEGITVPLTLHMPAKNAGDRIPHDLLKPHIAALKELSESYTGDARTESHQFHAQHVAAYLLYYLPLNAFKLQHLLRSVSEFVKEKDHLSVLDYGSGPGTASVATALTFSQKMTTLCVDKNLHMREAAKNLLGALSHVRPLTFATGSTLPEDAPHFDLIFACNVLNELAPEEQRYFLSYAMEALNDQGLLVLLEPGTQRATRNLMAHRDSIVNVFPDIAPLYPCTHKKPCPLLPDPHEWCHSELLFERTTLFHQLDELSGFNKHMIKFSACIFGKNLPLRDGYRVITEAEKSKIGSTAYLCGDSYRGLVQLLKRNRNDGNRAFDKVSMHDRIIVDPALSTGDIGKETTVTQAV